MLETLEYPKPWLLLQIAGVFALGYVDTVTAIRVRGWARGSRLNPAPPFVTGRIREAAETGAQAIVTPSQTCCLGLMNGVKETGSSLRVLHLSDVVAAAVCPEVSADNVAAAFAQP